MTTTTPPSLDAIDCTGIPDVDGTSFREVLERQFAPLTDYEAKHGTLNKTPYSETDIFSAIGLDGRDFGRWRSMYISTTEEGHGPYLVIETRNGGSGAECDESVNCGHCNACIEHQIPDYPGWIEAEYAGGDSMHYFALPPLPEDRYWPGLSTGYSQVIRLAERRDSMIAGREVPWSMCPVHQDRTTKLSWVAGSSSSRTSTDYDKETLAVYESQIADLRDAMSRAEPVDHMPKPMRRRKTGAYGKPLKATEPVPVPDLATALSSLEKFDRSTTERNAITRDLERFAEQTDIDPATRTHLLQEIASRRKTDDKLAAHHQRDRDIKAWQVKMATLRAPRDLAEKERLRDALIARISRAEQDAERSRDNNWLRWPGESYDEYRVWMDTHPLDR